MDISAKNYTPAITEKDGKAIGFLPAGQLRTVKIPDYLTEENLATLPAEQVMELIRANGAALGLTAMIKLAAGIGGTPPNTQYNAAKFLIEAGALVAEAEKNRDSLPEGLRSLPREQLVEIIRDLEARALQNPVSK